MTVAYLEIVETGQQGAYGGLGVLRVHFGHLLVALRGHLPQERAQIAAHVAVGAVKHTRLRDLSKGLQQAQNEKLSVKRTGNELVHLPCTALVNDTTAVYMFFLQQHSLTFEPLTPDMWRNQVVCFVIKVLKNVSVGLSQKNSAANIRKEHPSLP